MNEIEELEFLEEILKDIQFYEGKNCVRGAWRAIAYRYPTKKWDTDSLSIVVFEQEKK